MPFLLYCAIAVLKRRVRNDLTSEICPKRSCKIIYQAVGTNRVRRSTQSSGIFYRWSGTYRAHGTGIGCCQEQQLHIRWCISETLDISLMHACNYHLGTISVWCCIISGNLKMSNFCQTSYASWIALLSTYESEYGCENWPTIVACFLLHSFLHFRVWNIQLYTWRLFYSSSAHLIVLKVTKHGRRN